jgi:uncharacterized protein YndB with AHSA1/START domain
VFHLTRTLAVSPAEAWRYWTSAQRLRRWWAPDHFTVASCVVQPRAGGRLDVVLQEGDGAQYAAHGRFLAVDRPHSLTFEMGPVGADGLPLFTASHELRLDEQPSGTALSLTIRVLSSTAAGAPALAGLELGWGQTLLKLDQLIRPTTHTEGETDD